VEIWLYFLKVIIGFAKKSFTRNRIKIAHLRQPIHPGFGPSRRMRHPGNPHPPSFPFRQTVSEICLGAIQFYKKITEE